MQPKDVEAVLKPLYTKWGEYSNTGNCDDAAAFYHTEGVMVEKGVKTTFGRDNIHKLLKEFWEKIGPHKFETSNETYQGTDDYLMAHCDFHVHPQKGTADMKGKFSDIWKKEGGQWKVYHEEYEKN